MTDIYDEDIWKDYGEGIFSGDVDVNKLMNNNEVEELFDERCDYE